jgi:hypothetical protein
VRDEILKLPNQEGQAQIKIAKQAYRKMNFKVARAMLDSIISGSAKIDDKSEARYLRGRGFESGFFDEGVSLQKALEDFSWLKERKVTHGVIGYVRVLLSMAPAENAKEAIALLTHPRIVKDVKAMMLIGSVHERAFSDYDSAKKWYLRAYLRGLPSGLDFYAHLQFKQDHFWRAVTAKILANLTRPLLEAIHGKRSPLN